MQSVVTIFAQFITFEQNLAMVRLSAHRQCDGGQILSLD